MPSATPRTLPPDQAQREHALDAGKSVLVRAPAGSGKTDLLTRRFLRLLAEVDDPSQIVAITFTNAAAAEMRDRILSELETAAEKSDATTSDDSIDMHLLARRALDHSERLGWNLLDLPAQLRISTIDSFCREIALQQPLLSGLGGGLNISEQPTELYRRAARITLRQIDGNEPLLRQAIETLLLWRDNNWQDLEDQLVAMLSKRDHWMHEFLLSRDPDWNALREELERPFARHVREHLRVLSRLLDQARGAREEAHELARFACDQSGGLLHQELAELAEFPTAPFQTFEELEAAHQAFVCLADLLLSGERFRERVDKRHGFPADAKTEKSRLAALIGDLKTVAGLESALAGVTELPPSRYTDEEWEIVKACFILLRHAAAELRVAFAETGTADFTEVAQIALNVLKGEDGAPSDATLATADTVRHLLVDEFQDTSRRQHQLLAHLIAAWSEREGRTCFVVGDPMQSIYFFRDADAELFPRVEKCGLEIPGDQPFLFCSSVLSANFRTLPTLVKLVNDAFAQISAIDDGSGVTFARAEPARPESSPAGLRLVVETAPPMQLHLEFMPAPIRGNGSTAQSDAIRGERETAHEKQTDQIIALIRGHLLKMEEARAAGKSYRIAVLGRARKSLEPVAAALREAGIRFRAVDLEELRERPEIIDALALAQALLMPEDRVAWLGVLRAPWCGLSLADLHTLTSADNKDLLARPVPDLLRERAHLISNEGQAAVARVERAIDFSDRLRATQPTVAAGTWLEQLWLQLGGAHCVDATTRANLDLLWKCLDALPQGEADLLGPALDEALGRLTAQPDPAAESDRGVHLMTIHKSKGLEFEVVIVPDLQAETARGRYEMLSWLERGLPSDSEVDDSGCGGEVTEFLVAPFQSKGTGRGAAKKWVDHIRSEREKQEARRLLYVACTRARDELHLFARPSYKSEQGIPSELVEPRNCLLATAWPAFETEIHEKFDEWRSVLTAHAETATIESIAASGEDSLSQMTATIKPTRLRRLPAEFVAAPAQPPSAIIETPLLGTGRLYERHEGGLLSRALGKAVHALLQHLAQTAVTQPWDVARAVLSQSEPRIAAEIRAAGVDPSQARRLAVQALQIALQAADDPMGRWILSPQPDAASEARWTGVVNGRLRTVQVDRVFRAGSSPLSAADSGKSAWWIIDFKTAHEDSLDAALVLPNLRHIFAPQIEAYGEVLRNLHGADASVFGGLYYPRMSLFDWWEP